MECCSVSDLSNKEVISSKTGCRLGHVCDVEINTCDGRLVAIIIWGKSRCAGLFGREDDIRICWEDIEVIGCDTILVGKEPERRSPNKKGLFENFFRP